MSDGPVLVPVNLHFHIRPAALGSKPRSDASISLKRTKGSRTQTLLGRQIEAPGTIDKGAGRLPEICSFCETLLVRALTTMPVECI